jgi:type VI secretion system protein ImpH
MKSDSINPDAGKHPSGKHSSGNGPSGNGPAAKQISSLERLAREPYGFDFFQAVHLLELAASTQRNTSSAEVENGQSVKPVAINPVGGDFAPSSEVVRFGATASQGFPGSTITAFVPSSKGKGRGQKGAPAEMTVSFMGLTGPSGVLPQHYTQRLIDQLREDEGMKDFFDLFNHRIVSHFYRVWKKYHFAISYEAYSKAKSKTFRKAKSQTFKETKTPAKQPIDHRDLGDLFTYGLYCLVGMGTGGLRQRQQFPDQGLLYYAGQFARNPPTAISLERMLGAYFSLQIEVIQFLGQWLSLSRDDQTSLTSLGDLGGGIGNGLGGGNNQLGVTAVAGERVWSIENKFRVRIGPLDYAQFEKLTPHGDQLSCLAQMIRTYVGFDLEFDVQLVLRHVQVPACQLASDAPAGPHLGWNTWARSMPMQHNAEDAVFQVEGLPDR